MAVEPFQRHEMHVCEGNEGVFVYRCVYLYMCICVSVLCICLYVHICICMYVYMCECMIMFLFVCIYLCMYVLHICVYVHIHRCMCLWACAYVCVHLCHSLISWQLPSKYLQIDFLCFTRVGLKIPEEYILCLFSVSAFACVSQLALLPLPYTFAFC